MFHNIAMPAWLSRLFPMNPIYARELDDDTLQRIKTHFPQLDKNENQLLRPCQATMPMGFKWAVFIAHPFVAGCLDQAYNLFRTSRFAPTGMQRPHILHAERAPFHVITAKPIVLHIIDDVTFVATGWSDDAIKAWHKITRRVLALNGFPINENKSCRLEHVEKESITFIGCLWDFKRRNITPSPNKMATLIQHCNNLIKASVIPTAEWQRTIERLVWMATLNRPLLACMQTVFASTSDEGNITVPIRDVWKKELRNLFPLFPMANAILNMEVAPVVIAFDASLEAGAVAKTTLGKTLARTMWRQAQTTRCAKTFTHNYELPIVKLITNTFSWRKVMVHKWAKSEHINGLEAAAAVLALESAIRSGVHGQRLLMLTDSLVVMGALQKGRSSSPILLTRCRRFAALALAQNIRVTFCYVRSANNPADRHTRSDT